MSETSANRRENSARLKRNVTKFAFRGREKMLRSLGRGDETKDEIIDNYVHLVTKQQNHFGKFQHDMKRYLQSITAMKMAAAEFYTSLGEVYEDDWMGKDMIGTLAKATDLLYTDLHARLNTEVITVLQDHLNQCNDVKIKVNKRGRKLVDFDASRRALASLQSAKKLEEAKLSKAQDQVTLAHDTYETLNTQLHDELPDLYDSRVTLCTDLINNISTAEKAFYDELSEVRTKLKHVVTNVRDAFDNGEYRIQRLHSPIRNETSPKLPEPATLPADEVTGQRSRGHSERSSGDRRHSGSPHKQNSSHRSSRHDDSSRRKRSSSNRSDHDTSTHQYVNIEVGQQAGHVTNGPNQSEEPKQVKNPNPITEIPEEPQQVNGGSPLYDSVPSDAEEKVEEKEPEKPVEKVEKKKEENIILPPHYLYTVQAQYQYVGTDEDELSFGKGDIIYVVEFPDPEEQDEGWQMGIPRSSWDDTGSTSCMGVFPENFTKKV